ncbi:hypothetical protein OG883_38640 [Streptomyces sp. NBC_01142]|uniref:hypothetical protein n=1 Tax=Streptomyces sp. NBC_01142 TaxID=2975865 RepID=UPI00225396B4|nr:hypothetical protein [Streptomyces sp. NBC_01142]MCX4825667.1 hypothetical protein [Streptomyces sp. NBC_01142]
MPEETVPTNTTPAPTESRSLSSVLGALGCGCAALVVVLVVVLVLVVQLAWGSWGSTDFPRVAPQDMASRAFQRSQEAYDVVGFKRSVEPGVEDIGISTENTFGSGFCYDGGLLGLEDKTVDGAYRMSHSWALDHVPANRAVSGLRRLHQHLKDNGWEVTSYREGGKGRDWYLFVQRDDGAERMSFTWFPDREYFTGDATGPCAYDPEWENGDVGPSGDNQSPPVLGPAQRD